MILAFAAYGAWLAPAGYAAAGFLIGGYIGSQLSGSSISTPSNIGPKLGDNQLQTSQSGSPIPLLWGEHAISGNVIWRQSPLTEVTITTSQDAGGKGGGGGGSISSTRYAYRGSIAILLLEGPISENAIKQVWANDQLLDYQTMVTTGKARFYNGSETQLPDPAIEAVEGVGNVPAFRGLAYVVFDDFDFDPYGNSMPQFRFNLEGL